MLYNFENKWKQCRNGSKKFTAKVWRDV